MLCPNLWPCPKWEIAILNFWNQFRVTIPNDIIGNYLDGIKGEFEWVMKRRGFPWFGFDESGSRNCRYPERNRLKPWFRLAIVYLEKSDIEWPLIRNLDTRFCCLHSLMIEVQTSNLIWDSARSRWPCNSACWFLDDNGMTSKFAEPDHGFWCSAIWLNLTNDICLFFVG